MIVPQVAVFVADEHEPYATEIETAALTIERGGIVYHRARISGALTTWHLYAKDPNLGEATLTAAHKAYRDDVERVPDKRKGK